MTRSYIGQPQNRVDGRAKVTGAAKYAAEYPARDLAYGVVVSGTIAKGRITAIDTREARAVPGVIEVFTHENAPATARTDRSYRDQVAPPGSPFRPLRSDKIQYSGQPVALVVAETFEAARYAATLVRVEYVAEGHETDMMAIRDQAYAPPKDDGGGPAEPRGDAEAAFAAAAVKHEAEYVHHIEHHNPMEMHASTVVWEGDGRITVYDKTQGAPNSQGYIRKVFGLSEEQVRVVAAYVGGAFGSGLRPQYQLFLAVLAARALERSVRVVLTRQQMFSFGYRANSVQRLALGADSDGTLQAIEHDAISNTSRFEDFQENIVNWSGALYRCENTRYSYQLVKIDAYTPMDMRAPGGATGMYALEAAMDELAFAAGIDPVQLRLINYTDKDQNEDKPFSSKALRECFRQGAEKFGWSKRSAQPRSMKDGKWLVGYGMATGLWEAMRQKAAAKATLTAAGKLEVTSATTDIGTGTYTIMTQIAAETLGLAIDDVTFILGDSSLPPAPIEGGSWTAASVGPAVQGACAAVREKLFELARDLDDSPFADSQIEDVTFADGRVHVTRDPSMSLSIEEIMRGSNVATIEQEAGVKPDKESKKYAMYTHSAIFAEVKVDEELGTIQVTRVVNAVAGGRILNPKTARSQILGGVVWGMGMALHEETFTDHNLGRFMNHTYAEYHVPVAADVHDIEVIFVEEKDDVINPLGAKGLGEIGIVGTAAAIANAIFHATGKRVRDLPITLDKLL
jgi:xanthine dehydrogenase YagR molybdenum-binding subunit